LTVPGAWFVQLDLNCFDPTTEMSESAAKLTVGTDQHYVQRSVRVGEGELRDTPHSTSELDKDVDFADA